MPPITVQSEERRKHPKGEKYELISKVAYLIGVPYWVFENEFESPRIDIYQELNQNKHARIIRNLCIVRTAIERFFMKINIKMYSEYKTIYSIPEYIPQEALEQLVADGIRVSKQTRLINHVIEINRLISDRINNCKDVFPDWVKWEYIRALFIMKDGFTEEGVKVAGEEYHRHKDCYPYKAYLNWALVDNGNILAYDRKFVSLLYQQNRDRFTDLAKVSDKGALAMSNIHDFVKKAEKVVMVVDCENTDPYRMCATLKVMDSKTLSKIQKIMLFDNADTMDMWRILESYTSIPVEYVISQRVLQNKSLVDIEMTAVTCREHYRENIDSFIVVSSDSDYWGLISSLPDARFLVMIERGKSSHDLKTTLSRNGIFYCYTEDFYDGCSDKIKSIALLSEVKQTLERALQQNINDVLEQALIATGIHMKDEEKKPFIEKHLSSMTLAIDDSGRISIKLNTK